MAALCAQPAPAQASAVQMQIGSAHSDCLRLPCLRCEFGRPGMTKGGLVSRQSAKVPVFATNMSLFTLSRQEYNDALQGDSMPVPMLAGPAGARKEQKD